MIGQDVVNSALTLIGVLPQGETASAADSNGVLSALNDMLDSWSTERLMAFTVQPETFALVANQQTYTFGTGGNFNSARPQKIENAVIQYGSPQVLELPMRILNKDEYAAVLLKTVTSTIPLWLYNDDQYPQANIYIWPVPSATMNIVLYSWKALSSVPLLTTSLIFPPGYARAIKYNLAVDIAPLYGREPSPQFQRIADQSKTTIKSKNIKPLYAQCDAAVVPRTGRTYLNILTGDPV